MASVHASQEDDDPLGTGLLIARRRVLTCAHVVKLANGDKRESLWVRFPKAFGDASGMRCQVGQVRWNSRRTTDLAVLVLDKPAPEGASVAPLRCPSPDDLVGSLWWSFGFPDGDPWGNSAEGSVGEALGHGWVRLDTESRYPVRPGFSGAGLWSPEYNAVVGIVGQANDRGDARAVTLFEASYRLPEEDLRNLARASAVDAGEVAMAAWGWTLQADPEGRRHWRPRARGVSVDSEQGWRFRGRHAALAAIVEWLRRPVPDRRVLVIVGSPGVGKSAVLGRIVTTADRAIAAQLPEGDNAVRAPEGAVACAVHAKGKNALDVAIEIARAASIALPRRVDDLVPAVRDVLEQRDAHRFNLVIDALDEAITPAGARGIIAGIVLPLVETCADVGAQVVVGTRRIDDGGNLLGVLGPAARVIDLDTPAFFTLDDLTAYAQATLALVGHERVGNPYDDPGAAVTLARRIAEIAQGNFLVAGLIARAHGLHDRVAVSADDLSFSPTVDAALTHYLEYLPMIGRVTARDVLTALAFAESPGLSIDLWRLAVGAFGGQVTIEQLRGFAASSAANFLVESSVGGSARAYRLFHQALNDVLLTARERVNPRAGDERTIARVFHGYGQRIGWDRTPEYLRRSLPNHALQGGILDELLTDDAYLLHADLRRLIPLADRAATQPGRVRARLIQSTPQAVPASPTVRVGLFSVTEALDRLGNAYTASNYPAPYWARWAAASSRAERVILQGHRGAVLAVCAVPVGERTLVASAGEDGTVRLWDPVTATAEAILKGHAGSVNAVCAVPVGERTLVASAGEDGTVRLWDPVTATAEAILKGHAGSVNAVCAIPVGERTLVASAGEGFRVHLWDPTAASCEAILHLDNDKFKTTRLDFVRVGLCAVPGNDRVLLAVSGDDDTVRLWDPVTATLKGALRGHTGRVNGICSVVLEYRILVASASSDGTVRLWDPDTAAPATLDDPYTALLIMSLGFRAVCAINAGGRLLLAAASDNYDVHLWDLPAAAPATTLRNGREATYLMMTIGPRLPSGIGVIHVDGRTILASSASRSSRDPEAHVQGHDVIRLNPGESSRVRLWDADSGDLQAILNGHDGDVLGICAIPPEDRAVLATASMDTTVRLWDPASGACTAILEGHSAKVFSVCIVPAGREDQNCFVLASASEDRTVRLWDPASGTCEAVLSGHDAGVFGVCAIPLGNRTLLASASEDRTVRLWDPATERVITSIPVHHPAWGCVAVGAGKLALRLSAGVLVLQLNATELLQ